MQNSKLLFELSPWFVLLCLILGAVYAIFLYQKKGPWSKRTNYLLAALRFLLASFLAILILEPLIEQIRNSFAPPTYVIAVDNSLSMMNTGTDSVKFSKLLEQVDELQQTLDEKNHEISFRSFNQKVSPDNLSEVSFDYQTTDLHQMLQSIRSDYEGRNLAGVILLSDGIYNKGISPEYSSYEFPIFTVGLGDTIPKNDVKIRTLLYNKVSYQGNKFPIVAEIEHNGFSNKSIGINVEKNGKIVQSKTISLEENIQEVEFIIDANTTGLQHYIVKTDTIEGEFTIENNTAHAYIDVVEGKEKILLAAASPHPDIKALLNALEKNPNYEVTLYIPGINELTAPMLASPDFNALILHQIPTTNNIPSGTIIKTLIERKIPTWYILGSQSDIIAFNNENNTLSIQQVPRETDQVTPYLSPNFSFFKLSEAFYEAIPEFTQISVPYGDYTLRGNTEVLFYHQIGRIISEKPLMVFGSNQNSKIAVLTGTGIWQWRLQEYAETGNSIGFDELISKTMQYLSSKEDKRRFKVYPIKNEFTDTEPVIFESEIYNELFEPIFDQSVALEITDEANVQVDYQFTTNPSNTRYRISGLPEGIYQYRAQTLLEGKNYSSEGEFSVEEIQIENQNLVADHRLLRKISSNSRGVFFLPENLDDLKDELLKKEAKSIIYTEEQYLPLVEVWWIFLLLLALISIEWFLRKYNGSY